MKKKKIVLTGGGTTGHVSVNLALIPKLLEDGWEVHYIGSKVGIEKDLVSPIQGVHYHGISNGKLRRYMSFENFKDIFKVMLGTIQSIFTIMKIRPNVAFSKGGFVSVPVMVGAWVNRVPSISHESDLTPGLANKIVQPFVKTIFTTFKETVKYIKGGKGQFLGPVIRQDLQGGDAQRAKTALGIDNNKPVLLVMGGSLGSRYMNEAIRQNLDILLEKYNIIHSCGKDGVDPNLTKEGYHQAEYINENLKDVLALADVAVSRSGANAIFEFLYYRIPMVLLPLSARQSRGDQILNAKTFEKNGYAKVVDEDTSSPQDLIQAIDYVYDNRQEYINNMNDFVFSDTIQVIYDKLVEISK